MKVAKKIETNVTNALKLKRNSISKEMENFLKLVFTIDPEKRLDCENLLQHNLFKDFNVVDDVQNLPPPLVFHEFDLLSVPWPEDTATSWIALFQGVWCLPNYLASPRLREVWVRLCLRYLCVVKTEIPELFPLTGELMWQVFSTTKNIAEKIVGNDIVVSDSSWEVDFLRMIKFQMF